jgi:hypothetical protein
MSKITDSLLPEDFGKSFETSVFDDWKKSVNEHEQASTVSLILFAVGLAALLAIGGLVGVGLFFILAGIGIGISMSKQSKRNRYQKQLGITNRDFRDAVVAAKKRLKENG